MNKAGAALRLPEDELPEPEDSVAWLKRIFARLDGAAKAGDIQADRALASAVVALKIAEARLAFDEKRLAAGVPETVVNVVLTQVEHLSDEELEKRAAQLRAAAAKELKS